MHRRKFILELIDFLKHPLSKSKTDENQAIFYRRILWAQQKNLGNKPLPSIQLEIAKSFLGFPYEAYTLDKIYPEVLTVNLKSFDCLTLIENVLAISLCVKNQQTTFQDFLVYLKSLRYFKNKPISYAFRLHYFTNWLNNAQELGFLKIIKGNTQLYKDIYLLTHTQGLKNNPPAKLAELKVIKEREKTLSHNLQNYWTCNSKTKVKDGDLIGWVSKTDGLDFNHTSIAYQNSFIHASSLNKKVEINKLSLSHYCQAVETNAGLTIARLYS